MTTNRKDALVQYAQLFHRIQTWEKDLEDARIDAANLEKIILAEVVAPVAHMNGTMPRSRVQRDAPVRALVGRTIREYGVRISTHEIKQLLPDTSHNSIETALRALVKLGYINTEIQNGKRYYEIAVHQS